MTIHGTIQDGPCSLPHDLHPPARQDCGKQDQLMKYLTHMELVGSIPTPLKNMLVSWDDDIPNMMGKS